MPTAALPKQLTPATIAWHEAQAWMATCPQFYSCPENSAALNDWLARRELPVTAANLQAAYESLMENGQLHLTAPPAQQPGGPSHRKAKVYQYKGSHYDRTEINKLKAEIARMDAKQLREFMELNNWDDFPAFLKV